MTPFPSDDPIARRVDPVLFTKTLEFAGVFRSGDLATNPLSVEIRYSAINVHPPTGLIRGTAAEFPELEAFFHKRHGALCELESVSVADGRERVRSKQVLIRTVSIRRYPADESRTVHQTLGRFELWDFTIDRDYGRSGEGNREMTFLLAGPTRLWMSYAIRTPSSLGNTKTRFPHARLRVAGVKDVRLTAQPHFLYASHYEAKCLSDLRKDLGSAPDVPPMSVEAEAFALSIIDRDGDRTDEDFEMRALEIAEILCLLVSFLSKANVTWYARTLWSDGRLAESYRPVREISSSRIWWNDVVLDPQHVRPFIGRAFTAYNERAHDGVDLRLPILLYVAAQSAPTIDEEFILLFRCLEKVIDMLDQKLSWEVMRPNELKTLGKLVRAWLKEMGKDNDTVIAVNEKMRELARPILRRRLSCHLKRLEIDIEDIGGEAALRNTIKVRDRLIHAADEVDIVRIVHERKRLETVIERVLLTLLDWQGPTNTPTSANRSITVEI